MAQHLQTTKRNRYPQLFQAVKTFYSSESRNTPPNFYMENSPTILAFGCSNGDEMITLKEYFPNAKVLGCDINLDEYFSRKELPHSDVFYSNSENIKKNGPYDIIFANSVLCYHPAKRPVPLAFSFEEFKSLLIDLNMSLRNGGILCAYNMSYLFSELPFAAEYRPVRTKSIFENGFVPKWHSSGQQISKKISFLNYRFQFAMRIDLADYWDFRDCIYQKDVGEAIYLKDNKVIKIRSARTQLPAFYLRTPFYKKRTV